MDIGFAIEEFERIEKDVNGLLGKIKMSAASSEKPCDITEASSTLTMMESQMESVRNARDDLKGQMRKCGLSSAATDYKQCVDTYLRNFITKLDDFGTVMLAQLPLIEVITDAMTFKYVDGEVKDVTRRIKSIVDKNVKCRVS